MLIDDEYTPENLQPTEDNIVRVYSIFLFEFSSNDWLL